MSDPSVPSWLCDPALAGVWARVRDRLEAGGLAARGRTSVDVVSRGERHALAALLGRPVTRARVSLDLAELDGRLRERSGIGGLVDVLPKVTGSPLVNRPGRHAERAARREEPLELARRLVDGPWVEEWLAGLRRTGLLSRRDDATGVVRAAAAVLAHVLARGSPAWSRVELAARTVGDAHALDDDRVLTQVVLRALAAVADEPVPVAASARRALWERYAVSPDLVSTTCLALGLRPSGDAPLCRRLREAADAGDPVHLTGWDLRRWPEPPAASTPVRIPVLVCENPRVLEAVAERFGGHYPVVCTAGEPNTVVTGVLARLVAASRPLRYHGDFDWPGVAIANRVVERFGAVPWLMGAGEYDAGLRPGCPELEGAAVEPSWDPELGAAMRRHGRAVHEESVLQAVLDGLADATP
jgi:uncharacterized protein (TIGR02679 family)